MPYLGPCLRRGDGLAGGVNGFCQRRGKFAQFGRRGGAMLGHQFDQRRTHDHAAYKR